MKLISLKTVCFKKLGDAEVDFSAGLNIIYGNNARGKSTILQAIGFALYGTEAVKGSEPDIRTWGETRPYSAELKFSHEGHSYTAKRSKSTASVLRDDELVANGKTECAKFVSELLGLNWKDFQTFVLSSQFSTFSVLTNGATALNRKVEERSGIDVIDRVQSLCRQRSRDCETKIATLTGIISAGENSKHELEAYSKEVEGIEALVAKTETQRPEEYTPTSLEKPADINTLYTQRQARSGLEQEIAVIKSRIAHCAGFIASAESQIPADDLGGEQLLERWASLNCQQTDNQRKKHELTTTTIPALRLKLQDVAQLEASIMGVFSEEGNEVQIEAKIADLEKQLADLDSQRVAHADEHTALRVEVENLVKFKDAAVCPTCHQKCGEIDIEATEKDIAIKNARMEELSQLVVDIRRQMTWATSRSATLGQTLNNLNRWQHSHTALTADGDINESLAAVEAELAKTDTRIEEVGTELKRLSSDVEAVRSAIANREYIDKQLKELRASLATNTAELKEKQMQLDSIPIVTDEAVQALRDKHDAYTAAVEEQQIKVRQYQNALAAWESDLRDRKTSLTYALRAKAQAEKVVREVDAAVSQIHDLNTLQQNYARLDRYLSDNRARYLAEVWGQVLAVASAYVSAATDGAISRILFEDGSFLYEENGLRPEVTCASGAQLSFIGIAVRIGLSRVLYGDNSLLIFDEPTESMSEENAATVVAALATSAQQVLVITHKKTDQDLASNVINR